MEYEGRFKKHPQYFNVLSIQGVFSLNNIINKKEKEVSIK